MEFENFLPGPIEPENISSKDKATLLKYFASEHARLSEKHRHMIMKASSWSAIEGATIAENEGDAQDIVAVAILRMEAILMEIHGMLKNGMGGRG